MRSEMEIQYIETMWRVQDAFRLLAFGYRAKRALMLRKAVIETKTTLRRRFLTVLKAW